MSLPAWLREKVERDGRAYGAPLVPPDGEEVLEPHSVYTVTSFAYSTGGKWQTVSGPMPGDKVLATLLAPNRGGWIVGRRVVVPLLHLFPDMRQRDALPGEARYETVTPARTSWCDINSLRALLQDGGVVGLDPATGAQLPFGRWANSTIAGLTWIKWQELERAKAEKGDSPNGQRSEDTGRAAGRARSEGQGNRRTAAAAGGTRAAR